MHRSLSKRRRVTATFIMMLLITTLIASFIPKATPIPAPALTALTSTATPTIIIDPINGTVGTEVKVNGTIDTLNGSYTVIWDETINVTTGYAVGYDVATSFVIPQTVGAPLPGREVFVKLIDNNTTETANTTFRLFTEYHVKAVVPSPPSQLQEGQTTDIWVNVTGGEANTVYVANITVKEPPPANSTYWTTVSLTNTTTTGHGNISVTYPADFSAGAHTNYTGIYNIAFNGTLATGNFTVGLTNATEYHRFQVVGIQAANYTRPDESAWVNITFAGKIVFSKNVSAVGGIIKTSWPIPGNASMGLYTVNITSSITNGTIKPVPDTQNFRIVKIPCQIQTRKINGEVLADVVVWVYNATMWAVDSNLTDEEGRAKLWLEGGNYTFEAEWGKPGERIPVGILVNESIKLEAGEKIVNVTLWCWIARLRIAVSPPLPFIDITLTYVEPGTYQNITKSYVTNSTGIWEIPEDMPTNTSYTIEARRYDLPFNTTSMEKLPAAMNVSWVNITIACPTYTMFVHVLDSKGLPIQNVEVAAYEWSSGVAKPVKSGTTNASGSVALPCIFGKYKVWVYNQDHTIVLNKTAVNLIKDRLFFIVHCKIFNVNLSVVVKDYFGNPIPNALVKVERENMDIDPQKTGSNGKTSFGNITGGEVEISVSVKEKLCETRTIYLDETRAVVFKLDRYVMVAGYPLETTQFIACISLGMLVVLFVLALIYRRFRTRKVSEEKEKSL